MLSVITKDYRAASVFLPRSEFDEFLFAPICADSNGMTLSVLSMLARTGVDPWGKAAELARLPRETANAAVASFIAALPNGLVSPGDIAASAARLSALLPRGSSRNAVSSQSITGANSLNSTHVIAIVLILLCFLMGVGWLLASREPPLQTDRSGLPAPVGAPARMPPPKPGA
jgi:hypothetical protein